LNLEAFITLIDIAQAEFITLGVDDGQVFLLTMHFNINFNKLILNIIPKPALNAKVSPSHLLQILQLFWLPLNKEEGINMIHLIDYSIDHLVYLLFSEELLGL